jgi:NADPH2:quinone reductase
VASSEEKLAFAKAHGADEGVNYAETDLKKELKRLTLPAGVNVLYDCVGGDAAEPALRAMAWEGRYLVLGFASGEIPRIPLNLVLLKGCQIVGVFWTAFAEREPDTHRANTTQILQWCKEGKLAPHVHGTFPLAEAAKALALIEGREVTGKVIIHPQE